MWQTDAVIVVKSGSRAMRIDAPPPSVTDRFLDEDIELAAAANVPALVTARSPEERIRCAHLIHHHSARACGPFVTALASSAADGAEGLLKQFEQAAGGTLFLDDIGRMPEEARGQLLWLLERNTSTPDDDNRPAAPRDVRLVIGSSAYLEAERAADASFAVLFYRLNIVHIDLIGRASFSELPR